jgi:uncharacterized phage protein (predicted DNA packaging)
MNELKNIKNYLRVDDDITSDDEILQELITASKSYISRSTGKKFVDNDSVMQMLVKLLVSHWYTNRNAMNGKQNSAEIPHTITTMLNHIEISPSYEGELK